MWNVADEYERTKGPSPTGEMLAHLLAEAERLDREAGEAVKRARAIREAAAQIRSRTTPSPSTAT